MFPTVQVGPLALPTGPLVVLLSFLLALEAAHRAATRLGLNGDAVYNLGYLAVVAGLVGARLGFVIENWAVFGDDLAAVFALTADGLSPLTGLAAGLIAAYAYAQRKGLANRRLLDALAVGLAVVAAGLALADLANGNSYGSATTLPWAVTQWGAARHPVAGYHLLAALAIGVVLAKSSRPFDGARFGLFVALYAASRLFLEAFHGDSATIAGVRIVQVESLAVLVITLVLLRRWATQKI